MKVTGWWIGWRLCNIAFEISVLLKTEGLLSLFHCTRVKERGSNVEIIEVLAY